MNDQVSGWAVGWTAFAAIIMILGGAWWMMTGFIAILKDEFFVVTPEYVFQFDATSWGWIHLGVGIVVAASGLGLFSRAVWARIVGVIVAAIAAVTAFAWIPWYPVWAIIFLTMSVLVIWALTVHGRDFAQT